MRNAIILALLLSPLAASAQVVLHAPPLWCEDGGQKVSLQGLHSTTTVQASIPSCTVIVYNAGTTSPAAIFSDALSTPTPKANPFTALTNGKIEFFAPAACYDVVTSGGVSPNTFPAPITYFGVCIGGAGGGGSGGGSVTSIGFSAPAGFSVSGSPVTGVGTLALSMPTGWTSQDLLIGNGANSVARLPIGANGACLTATAGVLAWGASPCVGMPPGTTNFILKYSNGPGSLVGNSSMFDDGINPVQAPNGLSVMMNGAWRSMTNAASATTVLNQLVERNSSGFAVNASLSSLRALGIAGQGAGVNSGVLQVAYSGYAPCVFDGMTVINDYAVPSTTTAGLCHDAGATRPLNSEVIGTVTTVNSGPATTAIVDFFTGDTSQTTPSAIAPCGSSPGPLAYYTAASTIGCDTTTTDGAGNLSLTSITAGGSSAGYLFFTASSQPTFGVANSAYVFAPTSIPTTYALKLPSALGTSGQALTISGVSGGVATLAWSSAAGCPEGTCIQNAPAADQTIVGAHGLIFSNASSFLTVPTLNVATINLTTPFTIASTAGIVLAPTATNTVLLNNTGLSIAGANTTTCATCSLELAKPLQLNGSTSGSIQVAATAIAGSNVITLPALTGTAAVIVGGVLTTTSLTVSAISGSVQCLHVNTSGVVTGAGGDCATGGSGTVTSIATTSPITGGTITSTGTIACATCVVATSPGLGLAHFAGSTQTVTSSLIVNADITASTIDLTAKVTGILPSANGGTANAFFTVTGPATSTKTFTFPNASATVLTSNAAVTVPQGGTGLASGTSGGIPAYTGSTTITSSGVLTANLPVIGGGAGAAPSSGTRTGNTTQFASWTGATTAARCIDTDASGNLQVTGTDCAVPLSGLTVNTIPKATSASALGNSLVTDDGTTLSYTGTAGVTAVSFTTSGTGTSAWFVSGAVTGQCEWTTQATATTSYFDCPLQTVPNTYASLPVCSSGTEGSRRAVNDSNTVTWGANIAGGSTSHVEAYCDGTNWTVAAK